MKTAVNSLQKDQYIQEDNKNDLQFSSPSLGWIIWGCAALFYLYEYVLRVSPSVMTNDLMRDFGTTSTALGVLVSFYYYAYVPLQIPCGVIVDRLGPRRVVTFSAALCTVGSFLFAQSDSLLAAQVARFMMGAGSACAYLSCTKVGADWFPAEKFAVIAGITMMMGTFGGTFGGRPFAILVNAVGWRSSMFIAAAVGIAVTFAAWFIMKDRPKHTLHQEQQVNVSLLDGLKIVASNPQSWLIGIYGGLMYVPLSAFAELWGVPYLMQVYSINNEIASTASAMVFIGMALGSPLGAMLSNKLESRLTVMSWSALLTLAMFMIVIYVPNLPLWMVFSSLFLAGMFCGGQILYFAAAKEINPAYASGTTVGFTNALVMVSGIIFQPLLGMLLDYAWDGSVDASGMNIYGTEAYKFALTAVPACLLVAWVILRLVKETHPNKVVKNTLSINKEVTI
jgi:sugar phosphate permease